MDQGNANNAMYRSTFRIAREHPCLPGHFPDRPLVPGVLLLEQVAQGLRAWRNQRMARVHDAKFLAPLRPDEEAELELAEISGRIRFHVRRENQVLARGTIEGMS